MAVRNCAELGENLQLIVKRLMANDNLVKLLYYTDQDPISHENLTNEQKVELIFNKLIKIVPRIGPKEEATSLISIRVVRASKLNSNSEFRDIQIAVEVFVPMTQWIIKDTNLRPFAILGEVQKSLDGKRINGLGELTGGDFDINFLTEEISCYEQVFRLISYD